MLLFIRVSTALLVAFGLSFLHYDGASSEEQSDKMFMVTRIHLPNVASLVTPELDRAHKDHIKGRSVSVTSANLLDENGKVVGVVSIKGFSSREDVDFYTYEDPFTKAGLYSEIRIEPIDLYVLNAQFARAPDWYKKENPDKCLNYTPAEQLTTCEVADLRGQP